MTASLVPTLIALGVVVLGLPTFMAVLGRFFDR